jgi:hypothetical protein
MNVRRLASTCCLLAAAGLAGLSTACQTDAKASGAPAQVSAPRVSALRWVDGEVDVFAVDLRSKVEMGSGGEAKLELSLRGKLALAARREAAQTIELAASLEEIELKTSADDAAATAQRLTEEMRRPTLIRLASGRVEDVRVAQQSTPVVVGLWRSLASVLQLVPGEADQTRWLAQESDASGDYSVEYSLLDGSRLAKRKLAYRASAVKDQSFGLAFDLEPQVLESSITLELAGDRLEGVSLNERLEARIGAATPSRSDNRLSLRHVARRPSAPFDRQALWSATSSFRDVQQRSTATDGGTVDESVDAERARGTTFDQALALLEAQARDGAKEKVPAAGGSAALDDEQRKQREDALAGRAKSFTDMVALLRVEPKSIDKALAAIRRASPATGRLEDALASAGSAQAQAALVRIALDKRLTENARLSAATSLIRVKRPSDETIEALLQATSDPILVTHAVYGLGTMARHLRSAGDRARAERISRALLEFLSSRRTDSERVRALRAIANSGFAGALGAVKPLLDAEARDVRGAALEALRHMDHPDVDGILAARLEREENVEVRLSALNAFKTRKPSELLARALVAASNDSQPRVRRVVAQLMRAWKDARPELAQPLEKLAQKDGIDWVRESASDVAP